MQALTNYFLSAFFYLLVFLNVDNILSPFSSVAKALEAGIVRYTTVGYVLWASLFGKCMFFLAAFFYVIGYIPNHIAVDDYMMYAYVGVANISQGIESLFLFTSPRKLHWCEQLGGFLLAILCPIIPAVAVFPLLLMVCYDNAFVNFFWRFMQNRVNVWTYAFVLFFWTFSIGGVHKHYEFKWQVLPRPDLLEFATWNQVVVYYFIAAAFFNQILFAFLKYARRRSDTDEFWRKFNSASNQPNSSGQEQVDEPTIDVYLRNMDVLLAINEQLNRLNTEILPKLILKLWIPERRQGSDFLKSHLLALNLPPDSWDLVQRLLPDEVAETVELGIPLNDIVPERAVEPNNADLLVNILPEN